MERKALRSLDLLRRVKETEIISTKCMLQLYRALIVPQLEYAAAVWQIGDCSGLQKVQRKGLAMCLGVPGTAGLEALEVEAGIKPLCIRREELAVRQAARIIMKPDNACLKVSWDSFLDIEKSEKKISPFGKMNLQMADMCTNTGISLHSLEKELNFLESLRPSKSPPEYWKSLGSSKTRTAEQEKISREVVGSILEKCDAETAIAFTDGSCLWNPRPCGAGACLFIPGSCEPVMLKHPASNRGSILLGELVAIKMALQYIDRCKTQRGIRVNKAHIFSDSQSAIGQLTLGWEASSHKVTVHEVETEIKKLENSNTIVEISWTPGHADIKGNEYADKLAKEAALEAKDKENLPPVISFGDVKVAAKKSGFVRWQEMWDKSERGRHLFQHRPKVDFKFRYFNTFETSAGERIIGQMRMGYVRLNEYLHTCNVVESGNCTCGEKESVSHYLLHCQNYETERETLRKRLFDNCGITHMDLNVLLDAKHDDEFKDWRNYILSELEHFVVATGRFTTTRH